MLECVCTVEVSESERWVEVDRKVKQKWQQSDFFFLQWSPTIKSSLLQCIYSHMAQLSDVVGEARVNQPATPFFISWQDTNHINTYSLMNDVENMPAAWSCIIGQVTVMLTRGRCVCTVQSSQQTLGPVGPETLSLLVIIKCLLITYSGSYVY